MRLTKLVPAMGLLAAAAAPSMGVELAGGTLSINGDVTVVTSYTEYGKGTQESLDRGSSAIGMHISDTTLAAMGIDRADLTADANVVIDGIVADALAGVGISRQSAQAMGMFSRAQATKEAKILDIEPSANLEVSWRVGEDVEAVISIDADEAGLSLDEAYFVWRFHDVLSLTGGLYESWIGYGDEALINDTLVAALEGNNVVGFSLGWDVMKEDDSSFGLSLHAFKRGAWTDNIRSTELSWAVSGVYANDAFGKIGFSATFQPTTDTYNPAPLLFGDISVDTIANLTGLALPGGISIESALGQPAKRDPILGVNVYAEIDAIENWVFAADIHYVDFPGRDVLGVMGMANVGLPTPFPSSLTAALSYLDVSVDPGNGFDDDWFQFQLAWLTNPTGSDNFEMNFELRYLTRDDSFPQNKNRDEIGLYLEFVATIP